jgi:hypothetical protein
VGVAVHRDRGEREEQSSGVEWSEMMVGNARAFMLGFRGGNAAMECVSELVAESKWWE